MACVSHSTCLSVTIHSSFLCVALRSYITSCFTATVVRHSHLHREIYKNKIVKVCLFVFSIGQPYPFLSAVQAFPGGAEKRIYSHSMSLKQRQEFQQRYLTFRVNVIVTRQVKVFLGPTDRWHYSLSGFFFLICASAVCILTCKCKRLLFFQLCRIMFVSQPSPFSPLPPFLAIEGSFSII